MTLEDVGLQVQSLMQELEEEKNISMMVVACEGNRADIMTNGNPGDVITAAAIGLGKYMADITNDFEVVEAFCRLVKRKARKLMENAGNIN